MAFLRNKKMPERKAIKRKTEILAECPLDGVCLHLLEKSRTWQKCGHYQGSVRDLKGLRVCCTYEK